MAKSVSSKGSKRYVVRHGYKPGVYDSWDMCKEQVYGFQGARYKSFLTHDQAYDAYSLGYELYVQKSASDQGQNKDRIDEIDLPCLAVDASCEGNPGKMRYRGVYLPDQKIIIDQGPFDIGTVNIGEFLAIVHAIKYLVENGKSIPIYSDSKTAISWVKGGVCKTKFDWSLNPILHGVVIRSQERLKNHMTYICLVKKRDTKVLGEIPADYGKK